MSATDPIIARRSDEDPRVPKPKDNSQEGHKPIPETGWEGETPSKRGGDYEKDFMHKPPYMWNSDKFVKKYERCVFLRQLRLLVLTVFLSIHDVAHAGAGT